MPANPKYLTQSTSQRVAKISAGLVGGYLVSITLHIASAAWFDKSIVIITGSFSIFLLWTGLFIISFLSHNGWKIWGIYLSLSLAFALMGYYGNLTPL
ncbi:MAG: hypothetical protein KDC80_11245 [Saprospiraceae bacterium]|nr:hypothetical protein [Saprospiraceae bacterium]